MGQEVKTETYKSTGELSHGIEKMLGSGWTVVSKTDASYGWPWRRTRFDVTYIRESD